MRSHDLEEDGLELAVPPTSRNLLQIAWQRKALVLLGAVVGAALGTLLYAQRAPVYKSAVQVLVIKKRSENLLPIAGGDPRVTFVEDFLSTHMVLIRSPLIIEQAVKKRELPALKTFQDVGDVAGAIAAALEVSRENKESTTGASNIITLSYRGPVADDCPRILTAVVESYQEFLDIAYRNVSDQMLDLITKAHNILKKDLAESEQKYRKFRETSPLLLRTRDGGNIHQERVAEIDAKRSALLVRQEELREKIKAMEKAILEGRGRAALLAASAGGQESKATSAERQLEEQMLPLLLKEQLLLEDYGADHPQVQSLRKSIDLFKEFMQGKSIADRQEGVAEKKLGQIGQPHQALRALESLALALPAASLSASPQYSIALGVASVGGFASTAPMEFADPARRRLAALRYELQETAQIHDAMGHLLEDMKKKLREMSSYEVEDEHLRGDILRFQQLVEGTVKRLTEINLSRDAGGFDARALSRPGSGGKVAPSATQMIGGGLMIGLLLGFGLAFLADISDRSFRTPEEVRRRLGLPLVGHIPFLKPDAAAQAIAATGGLALDPLLCTYHRPKSIEAEAYRAVRTALFFSTQGESHKIIQITSPNKGDGKSLLISNLAISIAQSGKRLIVVDADCRRPRQHKIFGLAPQSGLTSVIAGEVPLQEAVRPSGIDGLDLLPCGPIPPNPSELLTSPRFQEILEALRRQYDFVLVDTPPLLAVTDPCVVAGRVDGLLLTLRLSRNARPDAERAKEILNTLGANVLGIVVNGVTRQSGAGLYSAERYEYAENYEDEEKAQDDGYYQEDEEPPRADSDSSSTSTSAATARERKSSYREPSVRHGARLGLLGWLFKW